MSRPATAGLGWWSGRRVQVMASVHTCRSKGEADGRRHDALQVIMHLAACSTHATAPQASQ